MGKTAELILETATALFNKEGVSAISTNHIAAHCQISPGNLYYHYKNKEMIIAAIFQRVVERLEALHEIDKSQPLRSVQHYTDCVFTILFEYPFFFSELSQLLRKDEQLARDFAILQKRFQQQLASLFLHLQEAGVCCGLDRQATRKHLATNLWIVATYWHSYHDSSQDAPDHAGLIETLLQQIYFQLTPYLAASYQQAVEQIFIYFQQRLMQKMQQHPPIHPAIDDTNERQL